MNREFIYERRQTAGRMMVIMVVTSGVALVGAIFAFASLGWIGSLGFLILGSVAFGLSRVFEMIGDLFAAIGKRDESGKPQALEKAQHES